MQEDGASTKEHYAPKLPPGMAPYHNKSAKEILSDLNKIPLFMTNLEENDDVEALRALAYEGTPFEVAGNFKEHGNESFTKKNWKDAKEFYEKAICSLAKETRNRQESEKNKAVTANEIKQEVSILESCLVNRAACHLQLQNYRSCIQDCGEALKINPRNIKAYYRSSKALLALGKISEAKDACVCGLAIDSENSALKTVSATIDKQGSIMAENERERLDREKRKNVECQTLNAALLARKINVRKTRIPPEMEDLRIMLVPDPIDPASTLCFPTILLYPLHLKSDIIKAFDESQSINDHLDYILPPPWDTEKIYSKSDVEFFVETMDHGLYKVGKKVPILKWLSGSKIEVVDELLKIFVLPKSESASWIQEFKNKANY